MPYFGSVWRAALWTCASLVVVSFVAGATVRFRRYILRHRAEILFADMESISLRQTTFSDVQPIFVRWRRWGKYDGQCSEAHCKFGIVLSDSDTPLNLFLRQHAWAFTVATYLGAAPTAIRAHFTVIDGIVWSESIGFGIEVQQQDSDGRRYVEVIGGAASSVSKLNPRFWGPHWHLHPEYSIWSANKFRNEVQLQFTPFANPADIHRLMTLNFSCLTRFAPCRDKEDIMPVALAQEAYWRSLPDDPIDWEHECDDPMAIERIARESRNIVIAKVKEGRVLSDDSNGILSYDLTLVLQQGLKIRAHWNNQIPLKLGLADSVSRVPPRPGSLVILFFRDDNFDPNSTGGCSPLSLTPAHLDPIRRGIAEDTVPSGLTD
jgi:hypothetical protein